MLSQCDYRVSSIHEALKGNLQLLKQKRKRRKRGTAENLQTKQKQKRKKTDVVTILTKRHHERTSEKWWHEQQPACPTCQCTPATTISPLSRSCRSWCEYKFWLAPRSASYKLDKAILSNRVRRRENSVENTSKSFNSSALNTVAAFLPRTKSCYQKRYYPIMKPVSRQELRRKHSPAAHPTSKNMFA